MFRYEIINYLISQNNYQTYLEIGVRGGKNFNKIKVSDKKSVDPNYDSTYRMTSDELFNSLPVEKKFDIIFIDGLHLKDQVLRDVNNSLKHLNVNGVIVMHDCNPLAKEHATDKETSNGPWNGTVFEAWLELRMTRDDLCMRVVDTDHGCGIIQFGTQKTIEKKLVSWDILVEDRKNNLNLISTDEFLNIYRKQ